ncbi:MAG: hypothetical protein K8S23_03015 [Candidatus Cloacimonetes bacterium]|nr:hypothetical protein [Candidatus Cloacimonadota bacterium]
MKLKFFIMLFLLGISIALFAQDKASKPNYKNVRKLKSKTDFTEKIDIRRPNQSSEMKRTETEATVDMRINIKEKIKKSNKLLY